MWLCVLILFDSPLCTLHSLSHLPFHSLDLHLHLPCGSVRREVPCALPRMRSSALCPTTPLSQYGEVHVVIRVRHHEKDVSLDPIEQPAIGGGETWLPDQRGVAPFEVVLHLGGTFEDGLHHLHSPQGPMDLPVVSLVPRGSMAVADARRCSNHCASIAGSSSTPRGTLRATFRQRIESRFRTVAAPSLRKRPSSTIIFALIRSRADDEKTPSTVRQENPW